MVVKKKKHDERNVGLWKKNHKKEGARQGRNERKKENKDVEGVGLLMDKIEK